nr:choice-of-anchor D domain-containing protein [Candidatus Cloacimonadota bacterium]
DGTTYSAGNSIIGGGTVLCYGPALHYDHISLTANTQYFYKAWSYDGSEYSYGVADDATTPCAPYTLPIVQGFNAATIPACWTETIVADPGTDPALTYVTSGTSPTCSPDEGTHMVKFNSYSCSNGAEIRLESPEFSTLGLTAARVLFAWYESSDYSSYLDEGVTVQWSLDGTTWNNGTFYQRYNATNGWYDKTYNLPAGAQNQSTVYVGFLFHSQWGNNCYFDDVTIQESPFCLAPSDLTTTNIGIKSADLGWTENNTPPVTVWDIEWGETPYIFTGNPTVTGTSSNPYSLIGLSINTEYTWKVRAYCGAKATSTWTGPSTFTTSDGKAINPDPANNALGVPVTAKTFDWDDVIDAFGYTIDIGTAPGLSDIVNDAQCPHQSTYTYGGPDWDYNDDYYWTITTYYTAKEIVIGDEWKFTTECGTYLTPFIEDFNGTYVPYCWYEATGDVPTPSVGSSAWFQSTYFANAAGNSKAVKMNVYGTDNDWLVSPEIDLGAGNKQVKFKVAATTYNSTGSVTMSAEDTVYVLITSNTKATWDLADAITIYTNTNSPSNTGDDELFALSGWTGAVRFAFYTKGTGYTPDMDIHFDDFIVEEIPTTPTLSVSPNSYNFGDQNNGFCSAWETFTLENIGPGTINVSGITLTGTDAASFEIQNNPAPCAIPPNATVDVRFCPTTLGAKTAFLTIGDDRAITNILLDGNSVTPGYCDASGGCDEYIAGVEIGTINNLTDCDGYADYTALSTDLTQGTVGVPITITNGNSYSSDDLGIWIDWNQDFDFDDVGENVVCTVDDGADGTYTFDVPIGATLGNTVMRIRIKYSGSDCGNPCGATTYGEVEDYTINVIELPPYPVLSVNPDPYDFGTVPVGQPATQLFTLSNIGQGTLTIAAGAVTTTGDPDFSILSITPPLPASLNLGESIEVEVQYDPAVAGANTGVLSTVWGAAKDSYNVPLSGTGFVLPICTVWEGEPCGDNTNGGCNNDPDPPTYTPLYGGDVMCGLTGTWDAGTRDTDWYDLTWYGPVTANFTVWSPTVPLYVFLISSDEGWGVLGCTNVAVFLQQVVNPGELATFSWDRPGPEGQYCVWVGPQVFSGYPCDNDYILQVEGPTNPYPVPADVAISVDTSSIPNQVTISWTDEGGNYNVYASSSAYGPWATIATDLSGGSYTYILPATNTFYRVTNGVIVKQRSSNYIVPISNHIINLGTKEIKK